MDVTPPKTNEKSTRKRLKPNAKWNIEQTNIFLYRVKEKIDTFEKPTAQVFYRKMIEHTPELDCFQWDNLRQKMRNLKQLYVKALDWRNNTAPTLTENNSDTEIRETVLHMCPFFDILDEVYGVKNYLNPPYFYDSNSTQHSDSNVLTDDIEYKVFCSNEPQIVPPASPLNECAVDEVATDVASTSSSCIEKLEDSFSHFKNHLNQPTKKVKNNGNNSLAYLVEVQEKKMSVQQAKIEAELKIQKERLAVEREGLSLQKEKIKFENEMRALEIQKNFELKTAQIASDEKIKMMQIEKDERLARYELDLKYKSK